LISIKKNNDTEGLQKAIDDAMLELATTKPNTEDYDSILEKIERLYKLKGPEKEPRKRISPDALISGFVSLAGIVLVVNAEHVGAVTSKAFSIVVKPKI
jgi:hypothetical protein